MKNTLIHNCNSTIFPLSTQVYNTRFVDLSQSVLVSLNTSMAKLSNQGLNILNLFIPKPDIPPAIAANYREVTRGVKYEAYYFETPPGQN